MATNLVPSYFFMGKPACFEDQPGIIGRFKALVSTSVKRHGSLGGRHVGSCKPAVVTSIHPLQMMSFFRFVRSSFVHLFVSFSVSLFTCLLAWLAGWFGRSGRQVSCFFRVPRPVLRSPISVVKQRIERWSAFTDAYPCQCGSLV